MSKEKIIYFIYAEKCKECENMRNILEIAIRESNLDIIIEDVNSDTERAIRLSIDNNIDDLPGCIIGKYSYCGKDQYSLNGIIEAIERTWKKNVNNSQL